MKTLFVVALSIIFSPLLHAVGNIVIEDIGTLTDKGFVFDVVKDHSTGEVVHVSFKIPEKFDFGEVMGTKPFQEVTFYEPTDEAASEAKLIAATGMRLNLLVEKQEGKFSGRLSLITAKAKNQYLEFHFNQGSGYPPMLIHVPLPLLVKLQKPEKK